MNYVGILHQQVRTRVNARKAVMNRKRKETYCPQMDNSIRESVKKIEKEGWRNALRDRFKVREMAPRTVHTCFCTV